MPSQPDAPYAALVKDTRIARGMTQEDLAREIGAPQQTIEKIETGKTKKSGYLPAIFSALGLDLQLLANPLDRPRLAPGDKIELPARTPVKFYVKEWREFCEERPKRLADALRLDGDEYGFLESKSHKFSIEQLEGVATALKIQFDSLRWNPKNQPPVPQPAKTDMARINKAMGRK